MSFAFANRTVTISGGRTVVVAKMSALSALKVSKILVKNLEALRNLPIYRHSETGEIALGRAHLVKLLPDFSGGLLDFVKEIVLASTRKEEAFLDELDLEDLVDVLFVAVELNLTEDLLKKLQPLAKIVKPIVAPPETSKSEASSAQSTSS